MSDIFKLDKDRSLSRLHAESVTASAENAAIAYQAPSLISIGAQAKDIAILSTISNLLFALLLMRVPSTVKFGDTLKRAVVIVGFLGSLGWLPLIIVPLVIKDIPISLMITLWVINLVPSLMVGPLVDKWLSDLVPPNKVGRYLSIRAILSAATYLSFFYGMGFMLDRFNTSPSGGFPILFVIAFAASMGTVLICSRLRAAVPFGESDRSGFGLFNFILEARQNGLGAFIIFTALMTFTTGISTAFFSVYMLNNLHFSYFTYSLVISTEFMARIGISYLGGRWIDRAGPLKVIRYAAAFLPVLPILWLFSANVWYLIMIQIMSGVAWATFDLCTLSCLCRDTPEGKRLHYIVYHRSIVTLAAAIGPLLGAMVFAYMIPVFGSQILGMFLLSGVLRFLVIIAMLPRLKANEDVPRECDIAEFPKIPGTVVIRPTAPQMVSHRAPYTIHKPVWTLTENCEPGNLRSPIYYPRQWNLGTEKPAAPVKQNIRQDLLYRREDCGRRASYSVGANTTPLRRSPGYAAKANLVSSRRTPVREAGPGAPIYSPPAYTAETNKPPVKVLRLSDNLSRDIEYHKRWASRVPCPA